MPTSLVLGSARAQFTITLSVAASEPVSVDWMTRDGTALAGRDYEANSGTVVFLPGETSKTVEVFVHGRTVETEDRVFYVLMTPPANAILADEVGACVIHVDTTGSHPVMTVVIPKGEKGERGYSAYEIALQNGFVGTQPEWLASLRPSPEELAPLVAPLIDAGAMSVTADRTAELGFPDTETISGFAQRIAYMGPAKFAKATALTAGDNAVPMSAFIGDAVNPKAPAGFSLVVVRGSNVIALPWGYEPAGDEILIKGASAGDIPIAIERMIGVQDAGDLVVKPDGAASYVSLKSILGNLSDLIEANIESLTERVDATEQVLSEPGDLAFKAFDTGISRSLRTRSRENLRITEFGDDFLTPGKFNDAYDKAIAACADRPGSRITTEDITFVMSRTAFIPNGITVEGSGPLRSRAFAAPSLAGLPMFKSEAPNGGVTADTRLIGMTLAGNGHAICGYQCERFTHSVLTDLDIMGTTISAIRLNDGYSNELNRLTIHENFGGGIDMSGINNNNVNFNWVKVYANPGVGVQLSAGWGVAFNNCGIEANDIAGIVSWNCRGVVMNGGYVERNGKVGLAFTTPNSPENLTVHADIHLLSGGRILNKVAGEDSNGWVIQGVSFTPYGHGDVPAPGLGIDCHIFAPGANDLKVTNCDLLDKSKVKGFIGLYNNGFKAGTTSMDISQNTRNDVVFLGEGSIGFAYSTAHLIEDRFQINRCNYASQVRADYPIQSGTVGALNAGTQRFGNFTSWEVTPGNRVYGQVIDLNANPGLRGKYVWFGIAYRIQDEGAGIKLMVGNSADHDGSITEHVTAAGEWKYKSVMTYVEASATNLFIGFSRVGAGANPVVVAAPALSVVGVSAGSLGLGRA